MAPDDSTEDGGGARVIALDDRRRRAKLDALTRLHRDFLRGLAGRLCRGQLDPDDLVQDVFEKTMRADPPIPDGANERAWLARMLHNQFIDKLRRQAARREDSIEQAQAPAVGNAESDVWWARLGEDAVRAQVAKLPADQRATFERFAFDGKTYDEIAAELGIAKATVGTRILRARLKIRELLVAERADHD